MLASAIDSTGSILVADMPKINPAQTNFTAGEISPRLMGRVDYTGYANGAKTISNAIPLVEGGAMRRDGLRLMAQAKYSTGNVRVIPYVYSKDEAYVIELGGRLRSLLHRKWAGGWNQWACVRNDDAIFV